MMQLSPFSVIIIFLLSFFLFVMLLFRFLYFQICTLPRKTESFNFCWIFGIDISTTLSILWPSRSLSLLSICIWLAIRWSEFVISLIFYKGLSIKLEELLDFESEYNLIMIKFSIKINGKKSHSLWNYPQSNHSAKQ